MTRGRGQKSSKIALHTYMDGSPIGHVEMNDNICIISKMAAKMAAQNLNLMYLCWNMSESYISFQILKILHLMLLISTQINSLSLTSCD